jgi:hypothetical protein
MSYHPNPKDTMLVVDALWTAFSASKDQISTNDPEGRSATLGATMFFGLVLGVVRKMEDRTTMCDAAGPWRQSGVLKEPRVQLVCGLMRTKPMNDLGADGAPQV